MKIILVLLCMAVIYQQYQINVMDDNVNRLYEQQEVMRVISSKLVYDTMKIKGELNGNEM